MFTFYEPERFMQFWYTIMASLSGVVVGTSIGWNSPVTWMIKKHGEPQDTQSIALYAAGCFCLGSAVGGLIQSGLAAAVGYKLSAVVYDCVALIGWLLLTQVECFTGGTADNDYDYDCYPVIGSSQTMWIGRFVLGFGTGGLGLLTPTYITHITHFGMRGRVQMFHQSFVFFGVLYSYTFGNIVNYSMLTGLCMIWPFLHLFITILYTLESPYHLYRQQRSESSQAVKTILEQIKGIDYDVDSDYKDIEEYIEISPYQTWIDCRSALIGIGIIAFQQMCGVNSLIFHIDEVFNEFHYVSPYDIKLFIIRIYVVQIILCLVTIELVEFWGRRSMLILSGISMSLCLLMVMVLDILLSKCIIDLEQNTNITMGIIFMYVCSYSIGLGPVVMLVYTDIVHCDRWYSSLIYSGGQFIMFLQVYVYFDPKTAQLGSTTHISWCIIGTLFVYFCVPDTRGQHLNKIQTSLCSFYNEPEMGEVDSTSVGSTNMPPEGTF